MIQNTIKVTIPFSFKGVEYTPSAVIDLDVYALNNQDFNDVFHRVATKNKISNFSYEYEVLESSAVVFSDPTGIAEVFLSEKGFDLPAFSAASNKIIVQKTLQEIAFEVLKVDSSKEENSDLEEALFRAFQMGQQSVMNVD